MVLALCGLAAAYFAVWWRIIPLGLYNDDALYLVAAQSLAHGKWVALCYPGHPPLNYHFPGFSVLLTPFFAALKAHPSWIKIVPYLVMLAALVLLWRWARPYFSTGWQSLLLLFVAFHPTIARASVSVMAEGFLTFLFLAVLLGLRTILTEREHANPLPAIALTGLALGWAACTRPEGLILVGAVFCAAIATRKKTLWAVVSIACVPCFFLFGRNMVQTGSPTLYLDSMQANVTFLADRRQFLSHVFSFGLTWLAGTTAALPKPTGPALYVAGILLALGLLIGWLQGIRLAWLAKENRLEWRVLIMTLCGYLTLHAIWPVIDRRFLVPVLPWCWLLILLGVRSIPSSTWRRTVVLGLILMNAWGYAVTGRHHYQSLKADTGIPFQTFAWIAHNTPADAVILTSVAPTLYWYTGRQGSIDVPRYLTDDMQALQTLALQDGITHLLFTVTAPPPGNLPTVIQGLTEWRNLLLRVNRDPQRFAPVYKNTAEGWALFKVKGTA